MVDVFADDSYSVSISLEPIKIRFNTVAQAAEYRLKRVEINVVPNIPQTHITIAAAATRLLYQLPC